MRFYQLLLILSLITHPVFSDAATVTTNAICAIVNDELITLNEVRNEALPSLHDAERQGTPDDALRLKLHQAALDRLVEKRLIDQKIRELNIRVGDDEVRQAIDDIKRQNNIPTQEALVAALAGQGLSLEQYRAQLKEQLEKLRMVSLEVRSKIQVGESEIRSYYDTHPELYQEEDTFRARHIFFKSTDKTPPDEIKRTMKTALSVLADAKSGRDFAELARTYSEDPAARKDGGDLGTFKKGEMLPELEQAIRTMKPGDVSDLVSTPLGLHIVKLEEHAANRRKPFDRVKAEIEELLYRKKSEDRFAQWARDLRSKASIELRELKELL